MNLPVILDPRDDQDVDEIVGWLHRSSPSADPFLRQVRQTLNRIGDTPELHPIVFVDYRRSRVGRTQYYVYYRIYENFVGVVAIVHGRRDPAVWRSRIEN